MSTRCSVEIYKDWGKEEPELGAILYHHSDGYPDFMLEKVTSFLEATRDYLKDAGYPYWWDPSRVAAIMITLSIEDYERPLKPFSTDRLNKFDINDSHKEYRTNGGVPVFQPCIKRMGWVEYVYKVVLSKDDGQFIIEVLDDV